MPDVKASGFVKDVSYAEYLVTALGGYMNLKAIGHDSTIGIEAANVNINTPNASIEAINDKTSGAIFQTVSGKAGCIKLAASTEMVGSDIIVNPSGILLAYGLPDTLAAIALTPTGLALSVGPPETGALIEMKAGSILLKVGETEIAITSSGIVSKAPQIESSCKETKVSMDPQGIKETVAEISRSMNPSGHTLTAAEANVKIEATGITSGGPISSCSFEARAQFNTTLLNHTAKSMAEYEAAMSTLVTPKT